ncbi:MULTISPECIES: nuclear transport factor 2 family protein [Comamonas]|jgi:uncharacterized protein|uniref:Nuclear transport factor 2 family protein n=1 Tax=Comamonas sediminis TaxID=1783360 RepID=A0ABV4B662_9BURK|nr:MULTISPECIES: nuclear transport factor 2 family protein [unclassified Comamonas]ULR87753.1 nuclear transport factor 2 family protein [Comamonas sp. B21-038]
MTTRNLDTIRATYEGSPEDNARHLMAALAPDVRWIEAAGSPYAGEYVGAAQIVEGVFARLGSDWADFRVHVHSYLADGDRVAAFGRYTGTHRASGRAMEAGFSHLYQLRGGQIIRMEQVVDSAAMRQAMQP